MRGEAKRRREGELGRECRRRSKLPTAHASCMHAECTRGAAVLREDKIPPLLDRFFCDNITEKIFVRFFHWHQ